MKREADGDMGAPQKKTRRGDEELRLLIPSKVINRPFSYRRYIIQVSVFIHLCFLFLQQAKKIPLLSINHLAFYRYRISTLPLFLMRL